MANFPLENARFEVQCAVCRHTVRILPCRRFFDAIAAAKPCIPTRCKTCGVKFGETSLARLRLAVIRWCLRPQGQQGYDANIMMMEPDPRGPYPDPDRVRRLRALMRN